MAVGLAGIHRERGRARERGGARSPPHCSPLPSPLSPLPPLPLTHLHVVARQAQGGERLVVQQALAVSVL